METFTIILLLIFIVLLFVIMVQHIHPTFTYLCQFACQFGTMFTLLSPPPYVCNTLTDIVLELIIKSICSKICSSLKKNTLNTEVRHNTEMQKCTLSTFTLAIHRPSIHIYFCILVQSMFLICLWYAIIHIVKLDIHFFLSFLFRAVQTINNTQTTLEE